MVPRPVQSSQGRAGGPEYLGRARVRSGGIAECIPNSKVAEFPGVRYAVAPTLRGPAQLGHGGQELVDNPIQPSFRLFRWSS